MNAFRSLVLAVLVLGVSTPAFVHAQQITYPISQVVVTTQMAPGVSVPTPFPAINIVATGASFLNQPTSMGGNLSFASNFSGEVRTVTFVPGSYSVTASGPTGYYFIYSNDCSGFTPLNGATRGCTITLTNVAPQTTNCTTSWYGNSGCVAPVTPYQGPLGQSTLTCDPSYQTVTAGQAATVRAAGAGVNGYSWSTADRTFLNIGSTLSTVLQSNGLQTIIVSNGVQSATCTVNVVSNGGAISYAGAPAIGATLVSALVPALPNTGFAPTGASTIALLAVLLIAVAVATLPYVRKTIIAITR